MHAQTRTALLLLLASVTGHAAANTLALFQPWNASDWTASDDSIRGGLSQSSLEIINSSSSSTSAVVARFYGTLDYEALNGSGFASQRTVDGWAGVDLSAYDRLVLTVANGGDDNNTAASAVAAAKTYSLNLKDTIPATVNGVEQAGVSWEYDFEVPAAAAAAAGSEAAYNYEQVEVLFAELVPTYRGSVLNDTAPLNLTAIKRVNFMIRR